VARPRLIKRLNAGKQRKLTIVSAPAGFGKTTLVTAWLESDERPSAWLSLDFGEHEHGTVHEDFTLVLDDYHDGLPIYTVFGMYQLCSDHVWDMDRAHDLINHFTTAFLASVLGGDTAATTALEPGSIRIPGISYQAEGY